MHKESGASEAKAANVQAYPPGLHNSFWFSAFNALSYQIVLGSPMVLYAKSLGASATTLGVIAGMMPLLVISQIPAADYIPKVGFKRFIFAGWGTRVMFIFVMSAVPMLAGVLTNKALVWVMLVLLFLFNLSRGISSCAWLPWITALVPASLRGKYLATDAGVQNFASFVTFLIAAACLAGTPAPWQFAVLFLFSAVTGAISLSFLKRMPDAEVPEESRRSSKGAVPWLAMIRYDPFSRLLLTIMGYAVSYGGMTAFTVAYLRAQGLSEGKILLVSSVTYLGGLSSLWLMEARLDRTGSRPVLMACSAAWVGVLVGWLLLAAHVAELTLIFVLVLMFAMGLLAALVQMSNTRFAMAVIPANGRNHFFAIYSVVVNVTLGVAPIAWGLMIDGVGEYSRWWGKLEWNRFSVFFAAVAACWGITLLLARRLHEPQAASLEDLIRDIVIQSPLRMLSRLWPRG